MGATMNLKIFSLVGVSCLLAGCQSSSPTAPTNPLYNPLSTLSAPAQPAGQNKKIWGTSDKSTSQHVRPDGTRVTETTKTSASVSFNKAAAAGMVGGLVLAALSNSGSAPAPAATPQTLSGNWTLLETSGSKSCKIELKPNQWFGAYQAWAGINCPSGLFGGFKWNVVGNQILLISSTDAVLARLNQELPNRWTGLATTSNVQLTLAR